MSIQIGHIFAEIKNLWLHKFLSYQKVPNSGQRALESVCDIMQVAAKFADYEDQIETVSAQTISAERPIFRCMRLLRAIRFDLIELLRTAG